MSHFHKMATGSVTVRRQARQQASMQLWSASKGIIGILAGQAAAREAAKAAHAVKAALIALAVFLGFLTLSIITVTFYVLLLIIQWFR